MVRKDPEMTPRLVEEIYRVSESNTDLARELGCSDTTVYQWITGSTIPYAYYLAKLYDLGCDIIYVLTGMRTRGDAGV